MRVRSHPDPNLARLVGREAELAALALRIDAAAAGESGFVFTLGEPGIGKSRLADAVAGLARERGARVLRGRADRPGSSVMRPFAEALLGLARAGWSPPNALGPYLAVLGQLVPDWRPADAASLTFPPFIYGEAILRVLAASGSGVVLLILEDLHDTDPYTLATLEYLVDNAAAESLAVLCTARDVPCQALEVAAYAQRRDPDAVLAVSRLDRAQTAELAAAVLGTQRGQLGEELCDALFRAGAGNPLVIIEIVRDLMAGHALVRSAETGLWTARDKRLHVPLSLARSVAEHLRQADSPARRLLEAAAVLGDEFPLSLAGAVAGVPDARLWPALDLAVRRHLLVPAAEDGWFAFRHPLIGQAVKDRLAPATRGALALAAAAQIEEREHGPAAEWRVRAAALRESAGDERGAQRLYAAAGLHAAQSGAPALAVDLLRRALACGAGEPRDADWAKLLGALITALGMLGRSSEAFAHLDEVDAAVRAGLAPRAAAELYIGFARVALRTCWFDRVPAAVDAARRALGEAGDAAAPELDAIEAYLAVETGGGGAVEPEALARRAIERARDAGLPAVECDALLTLGAVHGNHRPEQALECYQQAYELARVNSLTTLRSEALVLLASHRWMWHADPSGLLATVAEASAQGAVVEMRRAQLSLALDALFRARFDDARELLDTAWDDVSRLKLPGLGSYALAVRAMLFAHQGRDEDLAAAIAEFDRWRGAREDEVPLVRGLAQAVAAALRGETAEALRYLNGLRDLPDDPARKYDLCGESGLAVLLEAVAATADPAAPAEPAQRERATSALPWNRQFVQFARAVSAGRAGDPTAAEDAFSRALETSSPFPVARHLALRLVSAAAARDGWGDPARWLREAEAFFRDVDNCAAAKCCRDELRGLGRSVRQWRAGSPDVPRALWAVGVTVREYEVLQLVLEHATNREIASKLNLSYRTVERHVANLLAKFGAANRRALATMTIEALAES